MEPVSDSKVNILDMSPSEFMEFMRSLGQPAFRARQVLGWVYDSFVFDFDRMTNLPQGLQTALAEKCYVGTGKLLAESKAADGMTTKVLLGLRDGQTVETVLMRYNATDDGAGRRSVCVSSQVGCAIGCPFCATGQSGFVRNLSAGEIVGQVLYFARVLAEEGQERPITNVVFMGQGEPLLNLAEVRRAVEIMNSAEAVCLGARHITISTAGIVPGIKAVAQWSLQVGLAVSLHAPNDRLRDQLVPVNRRYPLAELLPACRDYTKATGRRLTFEYALIAGVNDSAADARELASRLRGLLCHVNLIPLNPVDASGLAPTPRRQVLVFQNELLARGIPCTVRVERGTEIDAACGQLRRRSQSGRPAGKRAKNGLETKGAVRSSRVRPR
ncbi:MAG: 23S rRNA (adenine(2503)-C(2))-methyltransferase RlmN [Dehalococcoidales bacterium]|nr:23S rRNA (adenine(2503)-C(2))-methyltransferase RlmN [Dehalococcoidales bacterium]